MDDGLKQRLVGAVVLCALALIFLPSLFTPEHVREMDRASQIPPAPHVHAETIKAPEPVVGIERAKPADEVYQLVPEETKAEAVVIQEPEKSSEPESTESQAVKFEPSKSNIAPEAWVVQVGSFKQESRATDLRDRIRELGVPSFTRNHKTADGLVTRVFAGPKISAAAAKKLKQRLDKHFKLETIVVNFSP